MMKKQPMITVAVLLAGLGLALTLPVQAATTQQPPVNLKRQVQTVPPAEPTMQQVQKMRDSLVAPQKTPPQGRPASMK